MKTKNYLLLLVAFAVVFFSSCNNKTQDKSVLRSGSSSGTSLQDTVLPKLLVKFAHTATGNYLAYYWPNSLVVDTLTVPPTLTLQAQSAYYDSSNESWILHNGTSTSQVSSAVSVHTDTVIANYAGPYDVVNGQLLTSKGYLCYYSKATGLTTQVCPIASLVYLNQNSSGGAVNIGFVEQQDLHSPAPHVQK